MPETARRIESEDETVMLSFRVSKRELKAAQRSAKRRGITVSEFSRLALAAYVDGAPRLEGLRAALDDIERQVQAIDQIAAQLVATGEQQAR